MNTMELFSGTESFSKVAQERGHSKLTFDFNPIFNPDILVDILNPHVQTRISNELKNIDIVWMSPMCTMWSLSAGNTHWTEFRQPKTEEAIKGIKMMLFCRFVADYCVKHNKIFFIENPNGRAVWILDNQYLKRCWYCQYGDLRAKPTNIWTNLKNWIPKTCFNNNPNCNHIRAKRGSKTGNQGLNKIDRSKIPKALFEEIFDYIELHGVKQ